MWMSRNVNTVKGVTLLLIWETFYVCYSEVSNLNTLNVTGERVKAPGYNMGLTVLVDPQPEDYFYPLISSYGTKVT